jgi:zinc protease
MFQGTDRYPNYDIALAELGGRNNAFTYQDATVYWSCAPRDYLPDLIEIEADRFAHIKVDFVHLEPEREVVKSERRQMVDANPGEIAEERAVALTFDRFPYKWGPIGWMSDLDSIPLEEAQRYHALHYTTDQTLIIVAGGFDTAETIDKLRATWGLLQAPNRRPDYQTRSELQALAESWVGPREDHVLQTSAQPQVVWSYRAPAPSGPTLRDYAALEVIDWALTGGKSGRLARRLIYSEPPLLSNLSARLTPLRYPYAYLWHAELLPETRVTAVESIIDEELNRVASDGLERAEFERAVASLRAEVVKSMLSLSDRAEALGFSWSSTGTPFGLFDRLELYPSLTSEDLKSVARRYLTPATRTRVTVVSPDRLAKLVDSIAEADPNAVPLAALLRGSMGLFLESLSLEKEGVALAAERKAIELLDERALRAKANATLEERSAIDAYMQGNEMGSVERKRRLELTSTEFNARAEALATARKAHLQSLSRLATQSRANLASNPLLALSRALATGLDTPLPPTPVPWTDTPPRQDLIAVEQLVLHLFVALSLDVRGQALSAQTRLHWVIDNASRLLDSPLGEDLERITETTLDLARDLHRRNLELLDASSGGR